MTTKGDNTLSDRSVNHHHHEWKSEHNPPYLDEYHEEIWVCQRCGKTDDSLMMPKRNGCSALVELDRRMKKSKMPYIGDNKVFRAVGFSRKMIAEGTDPGRANHIAANKYGVPVKRVAYYVYNTLDRKGLSDIDGPNEQHDEGLTVAPNLV